MPNDSPCRAIIAREADEVTSSSVSFREGMAMTWRVKLISAIARR